MELFEKENLERMQFAHGKLKLLLSRLTPEQGTFAAPIEGVGMARREVAGVAEHRFDRPVVSLLVQGEKDTLIGSKEYKMQSGDILTVCLDMPSSSRIVAASKDEPLLTLYFYLNPQIIREILLDLTWSEMPGPDFLGITVDKADVDFMEAMLKLALIAANPRQIPVRAELALRDLHYLLLTGPQANAIKGVFSHGKFQGNLFKAVDYLRAHLNGDASINELARVCNMSESTLYRHFKALTGMSPLQYHKQLRLHEARKLILTNQEQAATAAYKVGYESVSQFSREYKRLFGQPPRRSKFQGSE